MTIATYKIENIETNKFYYGSSKEVDRRIKRHKHDLRKNIHHCIYLQRAFNKYGENKFKFYLDKEYDDETSARLYESNVISDPNILHLLYNTSRVAGGGDLISYHPNRDAIVEKITNCILLRYSKMTSSEKKEKYGLPGKLNGMYGKTHTPETKELISQLHKGNKYNLGRKASIETREKFSKIASERIGEKNPFYGKKHSEESKQKISAKNKGNLPVNCRKVCINTVIFDSVTEASRELKVVPATIIWRIKSKNYPKYEYYNET